MGNRMSAVLGAVKRRKRGVANVVSVGAIGALALGTLGTGVATAQGMIGSADIKDQSINSWDIGHNQVGASELRGPAHDAGPAVDSHHVQDQSLGHWDIKDGTIGEWDLNEDVTNQLGEQTSTDSTTNLDGQTDLPADTETDVASLDVSEGALVIGSLTASSSANGNNVVCSLMSGGDPIAEANEKLGPDGQQNGSMTLAGVASAGTVTLSCHSGSGNAFVTDVSLSTVNLG